MSTPTAVGIDLGTTNSLAAYLRDGVPVVVRDDNGVSLVPSCLSFHADGTVLVGTAAKERALADPEHTIFSVKRLMGRSLADLKDDLAMIPQQLVEREVEAGRKVLRVKVGERELTPEELSAMILREVAAGGEPDQGRHHGTGLLRRCPAAGHTGCRTHRRAGCTADRE